MTSDRDHENNRAMGGKPNEHAGRHKPEWTNGLRQLYDSVVDEPLPDSFKDLLSKLDDER